MRRQLPLSYVVAILLEAASCAGGADSGGGAGGAGGGNTGAGGGSGGSTVGTGGSSGSGGSTGAGGVSGSGGSGGSTGGAGGGTGGAGGGTGGAGGSASAAWKCPARTFTPPTAAVVNALAPQRLTGVPPADTFGQGFSILEGAVWINDTLYLSQITGGAGPPPARLLSVVPGGAAMVASADLGGNGMAVAANGDIVAAVHKDGSIRRFAPATPATQTVVAATYMGQRFDSPNDLAVRSDGNIYFSDPDYQAPATHPQTATRLYRVSPSGTLSVVDETLNEPNGVTLSLDESTLYVSGQQGVFRYPLTADGTPGARAANGSSSAALSGSDGMGIDCAGDLWVTTNQNVVVVNPSGTEIGRFALTGVDGATNVAFGGADHMTVFITSRGSTPGLFTVTSPLPGMPY